MVENQSAARQSQLPFKHKQKMLQIGNSDDLIEIDMDEVEEEFDDQDRFLIDSAKSRGGVNVPMNSLPKLSRHRKSDLLANELEGNPQKPSINSVHFSKRRVVEGTDGLHNRGKVEDSGATQSKILQASVASAGNLEPNITIVDYQQRRSEELSMSTGGGMFIQSNSVSEGSMKISKGLHKESVTFNRISLLDQDHIKAPRGQHYAADHQKITVIDNVYSGTATPGDERSSQRPQSQRTVQVTEKNSNRQKQFNKFFQGEDNKTTFQGDDELCMADLVTNPVEPLAADSPLNVEDLASFADENVGDTSPRKEEKVNLSASENLSLSQYLSNSFQNATKRSSHLKNLMTKSLTNSQGILSSQGTHTLIRKLEVANKRHPMPQLMTSANKKKEKVNFRLQPRVTNKHTIANNFQSVKLNATSPNKLSRISSSKASREQEYSGKKTVIQSKFNSSNTTPTASGEKSKSSNKIRFESQPKRVPFNVKSRMKKNEPHTMSVKQGMEPLKMMKTSSLPDTFSQHAKTSVQKVKESSTRKRASFFEERKSGLGFGGGSFFKEQDTPNSFVNSNQVVKDHNDPHNVQIEMIDVINDQKWSSSHHIGQSALQRGMSPPANVKELSSDSRSSANIVDQQSPSVNATEKSLNSSHYQLNKYNRSAYKLKQYISDVNKINLRQSELQTKSKITGATKGKKKITNQVKPSKKLKIGGEKRASTSSAHTATVRKKAGFAQNRSNTANQHQWNQSQLTTQNSSTQPQLMKSQRSQPMYKRTKYQKQRSTSPRGGESNSLSRVLSYCPTSSQRQSLNQPRPGSRNNLLSTQQIQIRLRLPQQSLSQPRVFHTFISFLDFMSLFSMMQTRKDYRWDVQTKRGKGYQPDYYWVHKELRKRMKQILLKDGGLRSTVERRNFWIYRSKLNKVSKEYHAGYYERLVSQHFRDSMADRPSMTEIGKDIGRTFPDLLFFQKDQPGQLKLHRILTAISHFQGRSEDGQMEIEPIGYTQGMNFIAGTALVHLHKHEENTFWFLIQLLCEHKFRQVFNFLSEGTFRVLCFQLEVLTQVYLPDLHEHLQKHKVPTDIYASNWFITMFTNDLPFDMAANVLDVYLLEGHKGLLRIALSILSFLKSELIVMGYDELMVFLSHPNSREQAFHQLDQYQLLQTSYNFKITQSLLNQLHRLFIVKEKLSTLQLQLNKKPLAEGKSKLTEFLSLQHFTKLRLCVDQSNVYRRNEWHILMLGPDDVDDLMNNQGFSTEEIEKLRVFYNTKIKDRGLDAVLTSLEQAIIQNNQSEGGESNEVLTPRQSTQPHEINFDIAQENYLRATNKMQVNSNAIVHMESLPARPKSKASSLSPEVTGRSSQPNFHKAQMIGISPLFESTMTRKNHPFAPLVPALSSTEMVLTEDILSNLISPKSDSNDPKQISFGMTFKGSMASTPKMKSNVQFPRPVRQRNNPSGLNNDDTVKHNSLNLPYGQPSVKMASKQEDKTSIFENWAFDLGSKLENLFKPLSLSPKNARAQPYASQINQAMYDSNKYETQERLPYRSKNMESNYSSQPAQSRTIHVYDDEDKQQSPEEQISALRAINSSSTTKERKAMTPHMMLSGENDCNFMSGSSNQASSFDLNQPLVQRSKIIKSKGGALTTPQKAQINESQMYYHAQKKQYPAREAYHAISTNKKHMKPPRSSSHHHVRSQEPSVHHSSATSHNQANLSVSQDRRSDRDGKRTPSLLQSVLSPSSNSQKRNRPMLPIQRQAAQIHEIPQSIFVERKTISNLNRNQHQPGYRVDTAPQLGEKGISTAKYFKDHLE